MLIATKILVATDFSEAGDAAWRYGRDLTKLLSATLHVLHVAHDLASTGMLPSAYVAQFGSAQEEILQASRARLETLMGSDAGEGAKAAVVPSPNPARAILEYAKAHDINLIVIGTHGHGVVASWLLGSVAEKVVRSAPCPVLTVRHPEREFAVPDAMQKAS
jgi:nucleotide-binding universal stress UspA family protein